jgi:hypothetical protein
MLVGITPETRLKFVSSGLGRIIQKIFAVLSFLVVAIVVVLILLIVILGPLADPQEYKDTDFVMLAIVELMIAIFFVGVGRGLWRD